MRWLTLLLIFTIGCAKLKSEIAADVETRVMARMDTRINAAVGLINKTDNSTTTNDFWPIVWKDTLFYGISGLAVVALGIVGFRKWVMVKKIEADEEIALSHKDCKK